MQAWVSEMATYLKQLDPHHLVTVGEEGFWGWDSQVRCAALSCLVRMLALSTCMMGHCLRGADHFKS